MLQPEMYEMYEMYLPYPDRQFSRVHAEAVRLLAHNFDVDVVVSIMFAIMYLTSHESETLRVSANGRNTTVC